jgi:hypothetical protein
LKGRSRGIELTGYQTSHRVRVGAAGERARVRNPIGTAPKTAGQRTREDERGRHGSAWLEPVEVQC